MGGPGKDYLTSQRGDDVLNGDDGKDYLVGDWGDDAISSIDGNDYIDAWDYAVGSPRDELYCGAGRGTYRADPSDYVSSSCKNDQLKDTGALP